MNETDLLKRGRRSLKAAEATLADLKLEQMGFCDRALADALPSDGVATSEEIHEGLALGIET